MDGKYGHPDEDKKYASSVIFHHGTPLQQRPQRSFENLGMRNISQYGFRCNQDLVIVDECRTGVQSGYLEPKGEIRWRDWINYRTNST